MSCNKRGLMAALFAMWSMGPCLASPFFGQHVFYLPTYAQLDGKAFDGIRIWGNAGTTWRDLEPVPGDYDFSQMDGYVNAAVSRGMDVVYTLGQTPVWASSRPGEPGNMGQGVAAEPRDMNDWSDYVRTVAKRYRGKIGAYEVMNEPRVPEAIRPYSPGFFSGSTASLIEMTRRTREALNAMAPGTRVVCPAMDGGEQGVKRLQYFLSHGGGQFCDVIGFHFYLRTQSVSEFQRLLSQVHQVMAQNGQAGKPLWDTEIGMLVAQSGYHVTAPERAGPLGVVYSEQDAARRMAKLMLAAMAGGVARTYWFAHDSSSMGSTLPDKRLGSLNALGMGYQHLHAWLAGGSLGACAVGDEQGDCHVQHPDRATDRIVWGPVLTRDVLLQNHVRKISFLNGSRLRVGPLFDDQTLATMSHQFQDPILLSY